MAPLAEATRLIAPTPLMVPEKTLAGDGEGNFNSYFDA
jgi:hypothetical protein